MPTFADAPYHYATPAVVLEAQTLLSGARNPSRSRAVRWVAIGDSQETAPGGNGLYADPLIAYELWLRYGNIPETALVHVSNLGGAADNPTAGIGTRESLNAAVAAGDAALDRFPSGMAPGGNNRFDNSTPTTGMCCVFQANLLGVVDDLTMIPRTNEYIPRTGLTFNMILPYITTQGTSMAWRNSFSATGGPAYFNANTATGSTDITAAQANDTDWMILSKAYDFGATPPTAANLSTSYPQEIIVSANASQIEPGPYFFSSGNKSGIARTNWAAGGDKMADFLAEHANWGLFGQAYAPNIVSIQFGANDTGTVTAAQYKIDAQALIDSILTNLPTALILLIPDPPKAGLTAPQQTEYNQYAYALYELAQIVANRSIFINLTRRVNEKYGWTNSNAQTGGYTSDGTHYTVAGSVMVAQETVSGLFDVAYPKHTWRERFRLTRNR